MVDHLLPGGLVGTKADHGVAEVLQALGGPRVADSHVRVIVDGSVDKDRYPVGVVDEIRARAGVLDEHLGPRREQKAPSVEEPEPPPLELRLTGTKQRLQVVGAGARAGRRLTASPGDLHEDIPYEATVQKPVVRLVGVAHQAVVAGGLTVLAGPRGAAAVLAGLGVEVAERERGPSDPGQGLGFCDEPPEYPGPALGGLVEEQQPAALRGGQGLDGQLLLLQLEFDLDGLHEGSTQRGHGFLRELAGRFEEQRVAAVLHEGDDPLCRCGGILVLGRLLGLVLLPDPPLRVEEEAQAVRVAPPGPAQIDPPQGGRTAVGQSSQGLAVENDAGRPGAWPAVLLGKAHPRADLVADAQPLFLVGADAVSPPGGDVLEAEEALDGSGEHRAAALAEVGPGGLEDRVEVAACPALLCGVGHEPPFARPLGRQQHAVDHVPRSLVVDDPARPELGDRQEAGAREKLVATPGAPATRDEGRERQAREVVARQEPLAREVPVAVEVRLVGPGALDVGPEELKLRLGLGPQALGAVAVLGTPGGISDDPILLLAGLEGRSIQGTPSVTGLVKGPEGPVEDPVKPVRVVPVGFLESADATEDAAAPLVGALTRLGSGKRVTQGGADLQRGIFALGVEDIGEGRTQVHPGLGKPDGVDVGSEKIFVGEVELGRLDLARHHLLGTAEEVLIVGAFGGTVREHEGRLAAPARAPAPLGVVGGCRRDVPQVHHVEIGDVDAELHRGGAEQNRQPALPEVLLALLADLRLNLGGVLPGLDADHGPRHPGVEVNEIRVRLAARRGADRDPPQGVLVGPAPVTCFPDHAGCQQLVPGDVAERLVDRRHQAALSQGREEIADDPLGILKPKLSPVSREGARAAEVLTKQAPGGNKEMSPVVLLAARARVGDSRAHKPFVLVEGPWRGEVLAGALAESVLVDRVEVVHLDGQLAA
ncbi:hypothetical protein A7Q09_05345 [Methylacidiphilum sp. Yel]|nr:hypothetical protein A7Q09_05345 [Methylacidiphilum sp. Yel]